MKLSVELSVELSKSGRTLAALATLLLASGCPRPHVPPPERISIPAIESSWSIGYHDKNEHELIIQYVPAGQSVEDAEEMVMVQGFKGVENTTTAHQAIDAVHKKFHAHCKNVEWTVIEDSPQDAVYVVTHKGCTEVLPAHEVGRVMTSDQALYQITYTTKSPSFSARDRDRWISNLAGAEVVVIPPQ